MHFKQTQIRFCILSLVGLFFTGLCHGQHRTLFRILENNKYGFIDSSGKIILPAIYNEAEDFEEGLAPVRVNGLFGFIDEKGKWAIAPEYDKLGNRFYKGVAVVFRKDKPYFINKKDEIVFPTCYKALHYLVDGRVIVTTHNNRVGVIDRATKKPLIDTVFGAIQPFQFGVAKALAYQPEKRKNYNFGLINKEGKILIPFGKYVRINQFVDGIATVEIKKLTEKSANHLGVIDTTGQLLFTKEVLLTVGRVNDFSEGLLAIDIYNDNKFRDKNSLRKYHSTSTGFLNIKGELVFHDTNQSNVESFKNGRSFLEDTNGDYYIINRQFQRVGTKVFTDVLFYGFKDGYAIVEQDTGVGIIDTNSNLVIAPKYDMISEAGVKNGYFLYTMDYNEDNTKWGLASITGSIVTEEIFDNSITNNFNGFEYDLLSASISGRRSYINKKGKIVWQEKFDSVNNLHYLNITFMKEAYYFANSLSTETRKPDAPSFPTPKPITNQSYFDKNKIGLRISANNTTIYKDKYFGCSLYLSNTKLTEQSFVVNKNRLATHLQAKNQSGIWKDIELEYDIHKLSRYERDTFRINLPSNSFWQLSMPIYQGSMKTKIRAVLTYEFKGKTVKIFSNEVDGRVNPAQFWEKYVPYLGNVMDRKDDGVY